MIDETYNQHDPAKGYDRLLFRPDRILQSSELNEMQSITLQRLRAVADRIFKEGDLVAGASCTVNASTGTAACAAGQVYIAGAVRHVPAADLQISVTGLVTIGVWLTTERITADEDPALLNPALGMHGYAMPGADRERVRVVWGQSAKQAGNFYPIFVIEDGQLRPREAPPYIDSISRAIERYDLDSVGGHYIVRGMHVVQSPDTTSGEQVYTISEGAVRIAGRSLDMPASRRMLHKATPDLLTVDSEPHTSTGVAAQTVLFDRWPMVGKPVVRITVRSVKTITHGSFEGTADPLPDTSVIQLEKIVQGTTTFAAGTDYKLTAGRVDWSPGGAEPAPGSTYTATYQHIITATVSSITSRSFVVTGALPGTQILVSYTAALRRWDRLVMSADGRFDWIKGISAEWSPQPPRVPQGYLSLATVYQTWDEQRRLVPDGVRMVDMQTLSDYATRLDTLRVDQAEMRLALDMAGRHTGIKKGLFADPFLTDDMRDAGQPQTGAIMHGALQLPVTVTVSQVGQLTARQYLPHSHTTVLGQWSNTGSMLINPYLTFDKLPVDMTLTPAVDRWSEVTTRWASPLAQSFFEGSGNATREKRRSTETVTLSETATALAFLREIEVQMDCAFGPGERVTRCTFDGIALTPTLLDGTPAVADAGGRLRAKFKIPAGVPAGTKTVALEGSGGSSASALFTGQGTAVAREAQQVTKVWYQRVDPLAQTLTLSVPTQVAGVDLWFTERNGAVGASVLVQLRETDHSYPSPRILAETRVKTVDMAPAGQSTRVTWPPVLLDANTEYALVLLCDDAITAAAIAELGKWDKSTGRWVTSQPYQVGVLLSSSNAATWTPHQAADLTFGLLGVSYQKAEHLIDLGSTAVTDVTDLMVSAHVHQPTATATGDFVLTLDDKTQHTAAPGQVVRLPQRYSGKVNVQARLRGSSSLGAVLEPSVQLVAGSLQTSGDYVSPLITAGGTCRVRVILEANLPDGSACSVQVQAVTGTNTGNGVGTTGAWVSVPYNSQSPHQVGVLELTYELASIDADRLRVRLSLNGTHTQRPTVHNLRVVIL